MAETYKFQAEINQLMSLVVNSIYKSKDVAIRELISNCSDALDKYRLEALHNGQILPESEFKIQIECDKDNKLLKISDTGIGMTKQHLVDFLGTLARSGSKEFMERISQSGGDASLIGQFGLGFLSSMLLANKVDVISKHTESDKAYCWSSDAGGSFTVTPLEGEYQRGTSVILYLKEDQLKYLEETELKEIIKKHSQFINYPIELLVEKEREVEQTDNSEQKENEIEIEDIDESNTEQKEKKMEKYQEYEQINIQKPIWTRDPKETTKDEYHAFYKNITNDWEEPMAYKHFKLDGQVSMKGILYVPKKPQFDMFEQKRTKDNVKLYVKKVLITDNCQDFMPEYLSFIKGVVDCDDLPLNVSREFLQGSSILKSIKNSLVKKSLELFSEILEKEEEYKTFYENYQKNIKLGLHDDHKNKNKLTELLRFYTLKNPNTLTSLDDYVKNMKENQKNMYYITGESKELVSSSPFLEECKKRDYDVLYMIDAIDEYIVQQLSEYKEKKMVDITRDGNLFDETDEEKKQKEELEQSYSELCKFLKDELGEKVEKVQVSNRLVDSPCVLVSGQFGWNANMERIMKAQALGGNMSMFMISKKTMEINPNHAIMKELKNKIETNRERASEIVSLLYDTCLLNSGYTLENMSNFTNKIYNSIVENLTK